MGAIGSPVAAPYIPPIDRRALPGGIVSSELEQMEHPLGLRRLGYAGPTLAQAALVYGPGGVTPSDEVVAEEVPVALAYNGVPHAVMMATPDDLEDFAVGFSVTEELVPAPADILGLRVDRYALGIEIQVSVTEACAAAIARRTRSLTGRTGCGICGSSTIEGVLKQLHPVPAGPPVTTTAIARALAELGTRQPLNARTGAVHAAAWATLEGELALVREDVGRHNALDKLVGARFRGGPHPAGFVVVTSRASFEMVQKATVLGAPLLAAISGPTGLALRVAQQAGLTLVGFARGDRLTAYTHPERLRAPA